MKVAYGSDSNSDIDRYVNDKISEEYDPEVSSRNSDDYYNEYYDENFFNDNLDFVEEEGK
jgi:hypothetical protein